MVSRAERTEVGEWWWTIDRQLLAALGALMVSGLVFLMAGGPPVAERLGLSTFHFVNRQVIYLGPTVALAPGGIVPVAAPRAPARALRLPPEHRPVHPGAPIRARDQGRAPLDHARRLRHPAVRIREADFRRPHRLGVLGGRAAQRHAGHDPRAPAPARDHRAARAAARFRPDDARDDRLVLACSSSPACTGSGCSASAAPASSASSRPTSSCRTCATASSASSTNRPATRSRSTRRMESFAQGGWLGNGPGEGTVKRILPDAHTDFIFAVTAEEFGIVVCSASCSSSPSSSCAASCWRGATRIPFAASR